MLSPKAIDANATIVQLLKSHVPSLEPIRKTRIRRDNQRSLRCDGIQSRCVRRATDLFNQLPKSLDMSPAVLLERFIRRERGLPTVVGYLVHRTDTPMTLTIVGRSTIRHSLGNTIHFELESIEGHSPFTIGLVTNFVGSTTACLIMSRFQV